MRRQLTKEIFEYLRHCGTVYPHTPNKGMYEMTRRGISEYLAKEYGDDKIYHSMGNILARMVRAGELSRRKVKVNDKPRWIYEIANPENISDAGADDSPPLSREIVMNVGSLTLKRDPADFVELTKANRAVYKSKDGDRYELTLREYVMLGEPPKVEFSIIARVMRAKDKGKNSDSRKK